MSFSKKIQKQIFLIIFLLFSAITVFFTDQYGLSSPDFHIKKVEDTLNVYVLDVGQGDSIFIETSNGFKILIDGGPDNKVIEKLDEVMDINDKKINYLILTHPHSDHVTGLLEVLQRYKIDKVYFTAVLHTSPDYFNFLDLLKKQNIEIIDSYKKEDLSDGTVLEFLAPIQSYAEKKVDNLNNTSIINKLTYKNHSIILTGDAEKEEESEILDFYRHNLDILKADIYKVGHHASKTASTYEFLNAIQAKIALISCGENNKFHHPHPSTIKKLEKKDYEIYRTDLMGTIHCWVDVDLDKFLCESEK